MLAAYGFINILNHEIELSGHSRWRKPITAILLLSVFVISPWLRITLHIPTQQDGITNMAVTPDEWREASEIILQNKKPEDLVITSLPQVPLFYGLKSDYSLNWASLAQSHEENFQNRTDPIKNVGNDRFRKNAQFKKQFPNKSLSRRIYH